MIGFGKIEFSPETEAILRGLKKQEIEDLIDTVTELCVEQQIPGVDNIPLMSRIINEESIKFALRKHEKADRLFQRERFEKDMARRLQSRAAPMTAVHEGSENPSEILDRVVKKKMLENLSLSYGQALTLAQRERRDLAAAILKQLDEWRNK